MFLKPNFSSKKGFALYGMLVVFMIIIIITIVYYFLFVLFSEINVIDSSFTDTVQGDIYPHDSMLPSLLQSRFSVFDEGAPLGATISLYEIIYYGLEEDYRNEINFLLYSISERTSLEIARNINDASSTLYPALVLTATDSCQYTTQGYNVARIDYDSRKNTVLTSSPTSHGSSNPDDYWITRDFLIKQELIINGRCVVFGMA